MEKTHFFSSKFRFFIDLSILFNQNHLTDKQELKQILQMQKLQPLLKEILRGKQTIFKSSLPRENLL